MKKWMGFLAILAALSASGCIESPLLKHADAAMEKTDLAAKESVSASCPLAFTTQGLCASLTWVQLPQTEEDEGEFTLRFWKKDEATESGPYFSPSYTVAVKLWMPGMGHGSSPVKVTPYLDSAQQAIPGVYTAKPVQFIMGGAWEIWVQLKQDKKVIDQAKIDVRI